MQVMWAAHLCSIQGKDRALQTARVGGDGGKIRGTHWYAAQAGRWSRRGGFWELQRIWAPWKVDVSVQGHGLSGERLGLESVGQRAKEGAGLAAGHGEADLGRGGSGRLGPETRVASGGRGVEKWSTGR